MTTHKIFDVLVVGGSYSGLSASMALGRALREVLVIDSAKPCNRQTPHSHNFITQDGKTPKEIARLARQQVELYETVTFYQGLAISAQKAAHGFTVTTQENDTFKAKKIIFATGVKDIMPTISGFSPCWGISIIHCPYCHGYEVRNQPTGILANGPVAYHYAQLIRNWTKDLRIFTNGKADFSPEQMQKFEQYNIPVIEKEIKALEHNNGMLQAVVFADKSVFSLQTLYARPDFEQHCKIPEQLGCELTEQGHIKVDAFQKTTVDGIFACGDNASPLRAVSYAVATGTIAGSFLNNETVEEEF